MIRRSSARPLHLLGVAALATAVMVAGCGSAKVSPSAAATDMASQPLPSPAASSAAPTASPTPSPTPEPTLALPHADATLEDKLPGSINGTALFKMSLLLSAYDASEPTGGDKALYAPWLVKLGKTPADVTIAVSFSLSDTVNFQARAIAVPGVADATLSSGLAAAARAAGWPVTSQPNLMGTGLTVYEMIDPAVQAAGGVGAGYVYARGGVLYEVVTDDPALLLDGLVQLEALRTQSSPTP